MKMMKMALLRLQTNKNKKMSTKKIKKINKKKKRTTLIKSMLSWPQIITATASQNSACPARKIQIKVNAAASQLCS